MPTMAQREAEPALAVGIELGHTLSRVAVAERGWATVVADEQGRRHVASAVSFLGSEVVVGGSSWRDSSTKHLFNLFSKTDSVHGMTHFLGLRFPDPALDDALRSESFALIPGAHGAPVAQVHLHGTPRLFGMDDLCAMLLRKLRATAQRHAGPSRPVLHCVLTVPAHYSPAQRGAMLEAASMAGLGVLGLLDEPSAAALFLYREVPGEGTVLVFDWAKEALSLAVVGEGTQSCVVLATAREWRQQIRALKSRLAETLAKVRQQVSSPGAVRMDRDSLAALCLASEVLGEDWMASLSPGTGTLGGRGGVFQGQADARDSPALNQAKAAVLRVLHVADLLNSKLAVAILLDGVCHFPNLTASNNNNNSHNSRPTPVPIMHLEDSVVKGAAMHAASLARAAALGALTPPPVPPKVTPLSLGLRSKGDVFDLMLPRGSLLPAGVKSSRVTVKDGQTSIRFRVYEGQRLVASNNRLLGTLVLWGLPALPRGRVRVDSLMEVGLDETITLNVTERATGKSETLSLKGPLASRAEAVLAVEEAAKVAEEEREQTQRTKARNEIEKWRQRCQSNLRRNSAENLQLPLLGR